MHNGAIKLVDMFSKSLGNIIDVTETISSRNVTQVTEIMIAVTL